MKTISKAVILLLCFCLVTVSSHKIRKRRLDDEGSPQVEQSASEEEEEEKKEDSSSDEEVVEEDPSESAETETDEYEEVLDEEIPLVHQEKAEPNASSMGEPDQDDPQVAKIKKIKEAMLEYEMEYKECIQEIKDNEYNDESIQECTGQNFIKFILDVKYETMIIISKEDSAVRRIFIDLCYAEAGRDLPFATGCDLMEQDILELLWNGLDFNEIIALNREKYTKDLGLMPKHIYQEIMERIGGFNDDFFALLEQIDAFKENLVMRLKIFIDERYKELFEAGLEVRPSSIIHEIKVSQSQVAVDDSAKDGEEGAEDRKLKAKVKAKAKQPINKIKRKLNRLAFTPNKPTLFKSLPSLKNLDVMKSRNVHTRFGKQQFLNKPRMK